MVSVAFNMKQKMITLDDKTFKLSKQMTNFSGWVRRMLILKDDGTDLVAVYRRLTAALAAISEIEDDDERRKVMNAYGQHQTQKRLGEFE